MPKRSFVTRCDSWEPPTTIYKTDLEHEVEIVDRVALHSDWKIIEKRTYGTHFSVGAIPLSLYDQGRAVCGVCHGMGVGVKVTARRFMSSRDVVASAGARLLSFVIVARTTGDAQGAIALCKRLGVGGELGYGVIVDGNTSLLYDIARSSAWFANSAHATTATKKPIVNMRMRVSRQHWTAWFVASKTLRLGDTLFAPYGVGSSHHTTIAADAEQRGNLRVTQIDGRVCSDSQRRAKNADVCDTRVRVGVRGIRFAPQPSGVVEYYLGASVSASANQRKRCTNQKTIYHGQAITSHSYTAVPPPYHRSHRP